MKKVFFVILKGGLGNQLFIVNFVKYYTEKIQNKTIYYDTSSYFKSFSNKYNAFCIKYNIVLTITKFVKIKTIPNLFAKIIRKVSRLNNNYIKSKYLPIYY